MRHKKGSGYIFKRGDTWYHRTKVNGVVKVICLHESDERKARAKAEKDYRPIVEANTKELLAVHVAEARKLRKRGGIKISDAFQLFLKSHERPDSGARQLKDYGARWKRFADFLASSHPKLAHLWEIDRAVVQGYADYLESMRRKDGKGALSAKTFNDNIAMASLVMRTLAKDAGLDENPFDSIRRKSQDITHKRELSEAEALTLLAVFDKPSFEVMHKEELKLCFHIGMFSGLRFSDAVNLRFSQVSLADNLIKLKPAKTRRSSGVLVTVPIHPLLRGMLEDTERNRRDERQAFVMPGLAARFAYNKTGVNKDVISVFEAADFKTKEDAGSRLRAANVYGFHSFRSTFCSFAARKGVPLSVLAQITGDNIQTLQKYYVRIDEKTAAQTINALPLMTKLPLPEGTSSSELSALCDAIRDKLNSLPESAIIEIAKIAGVKT